jgi:hypothetical protein
MIEVIAEHSVDIALLPIRGANILDAGCRGFQFTDYMRSQGHYVCAIDCDSLIDTRLYMILALSDYTGRAGVARLDDPQATRICPGEDVSCVTLEELSYWEGVECWDLIKMDIEGSEREVIMSMEKAWAKQLSIESHLHTGVYGIQQVKEMENKLTSLGYYPAKHEMTKQHGLGLNYWDSLWILQ